MITIKLFHLFITFSFQFLGTEYFNIWRSWDKLLVKSLLTMIISFVCFVYPFITEQRIHSQNLNFSPLIYKQSCGYSLPVQCLEVVTFLLNVQIHLGRCLLYCLKLNLSKYISLEQHKRQAALNKLNSLDLANRRASCLIQLLELYLQ